MNKRATYSSRSVFQKAVFNIFFQIIPIALALSLTPYLIWSMGKDQWAKYTVGISFIFLSNYFSFGIGPTLNRRVSRWIGLNKKEKVPEELNDCVRLSYILGLGFFLLLQLSLYLALYFGKLSILQSFNDHLFFALSIVNFLIVFFTIPFRSILESYSDFYFLAVMRAITAGTFFVLPVLFLWFYEDILIPVAIGFIFFYIILYAVFLFRVSYISNIQGIPNIRAIRFPSLGSLFSVSLTFLKETFYFSLFFLTSAIVLFFDRFYYPAFYDTQVIADQVTLLDLFNRVAILTGTLSLVYFSATSVWFQEGKLAKIRYNLYLQIGATLMIFTFGMVVGYLYLNDLLQWWLKSSYSDFIAQNAINLLLGIFLVNFTILLIRPLQAIGEIKIVSLILVGTTCLYMALVIFLGFTRRIEYHYVALTTKGLIDCLLLSFLMKRRRII